MPVSNGHGREVTAAPIHAAMMGDFGSGVGRGGFSNYIVRFLSFSYLDQYLNFYCFFSGKVKASRVD